MYQQHKIFSIGYYAYCLYDDSLSKYFHHGNDCIAWIVKELRNLTHKINTILSNVPMADFTRRLTKIWQHVLPYVRKKSFAPNDTRIRDHYLTGQFRGLAYSNCNLNYKDSHCILLVFHNLSGYDSHFIIKEIATAYEGCMCRHTCYN